MNALKPLIVRALREAGRTPDALFPSIFIPLFFLVVNVGQVAKIFPAGQTAFLEGQNYAAFQLPSSILLSTSFGGAAFYLVEEIEGGYFDKLRAAPIPRVALIGGRLGAEAVKSFLLTAVMLFIGMLFGVRIASGPLGFLLLLVLTALWGVVFSGFMQLVALKTRSVPATQSASMIFFPLLFLTPSFVPRNLLSRPMEIAASFNPVTYLMEALRSLVLEGFDWTAIGWGVLVIAGGGIVMTALSVRMINNYD